MNYGSLRLDPAGLFTRNTLTKILPEPTPTGKPVFKIVGAVSEFEKDIIKERVVAGLANARLKGKRIGRPPTPFSMLDKNHKMRIEELSFRKIRKDKKTF